MPRIVRLTANAPIKVEPREKPISICACGLSRTFPLCDGAHKRLKDTEPDADALYVYDDERLNIVETRRDAKPGPSADAPPPT
jgi:CDGSH-type Zn-finger protein